MRGRSEIKKDLLWWAVYSEYDANLHRYIDNCQRAGPYRNNVIGAEGFLSFAFNGNWLISTDEYKPE